MPGGTDSERPGTHNYDPCERARHRGSDPLALACTMQRGTGQSPIERPSLIDTPVHLRSVTPKKLHRRRRREESISTSSGWNAAAQLTTAALSIAVVPIIVAR